MRWVLRDEDIFQVNKNESNVEERDDGTRERTFQVDLYLSQPFHPFCS